MQSSWTHAGIDGCKAGWWAWLTNEHGDWQGHLYPTLAEFWAQHGPTLQVVLIDMPIGLLPQGEASQRPVDLWAKSHLPGRKSSIFSPPARPALEVLATTPDYRAVCATNQAAVGKMISKQAYYISFKIRELDELLLGQPRARGIFGETHPELAFGYLGQGQLPPPKKTKEGQAARMNLLAPRLPQLHTLYSTVRGQYLKKQVQDDDLLDALALAVLATTPLQSFPHHHATDAHGLPMRMVLPQDFEAVMPNPLPKK